MDEYILAEFSVFYKRLTIVEYCLKSLIIKKYTYFYGDNAYKILYRYFQNVENRRMTGKIFEKIFYSNKSNEEKLSLSINKMYLSELLNLFTNAVFLRNKKVKNNFFNKQIHTNTTDFQKQQKALNNFRNCLAHCDIKKYSNERKRLINGLLYFENLLNCNPVMTISFINQINITKKLSVYEILAFIYNLDKTYFNDDKLLINLFDDIALINGYTFYSLPQRWSIIRQKFEIQKKAKENKPIDSILMAQKNQLTLDLN